MLLDKIDPRQRAWIEIKPEAIEANVLEIRRHLLPSNCSLMAVVKADGYGHGALTVAKAALKGGAANLGVATLQEGLDLRQAGISAPILLLGNLTNSQEINICMNWDLMLTISSFEEIQLCQKLANKEAQNISVHLKVDTGMTRLGCDLQDADQLIRMIERSENIILKGLYSHLALADGDFPGKGRKVTFLQKEKFDKLLNSLEIKNKSIIRHLANSAGTLRDCGISYDMVRVGIALYGYNPLGEQLTKTISLKPALSVKARITMIKKVPSGTGVSYGHTFVTDRPSILAVVAIGYADGVARALSGKISVLIEGKLFPQVGAITMDQLIIDITEDSSIKTGTVVTLLGSDDNKCLSPYEWSELSGSIPWEILCSFKYRLPRVIV